MAFVGDFSSGRSGRILPFSLGVQHRQWDRVVSPKMCILNSPCTVVLGGELEWGRRLNFEDFLFSFLNL